MTWSASRTMKQAIKAIESIGFDSFGDCEIRGGGYGESGYITFQPASHDLTLVIRVSDHAQPPFGGYSVERGERHGKADYSISPCERSIVGLRTWLLEQINLSNLPYLPGLNHDEQMMNLGRS